MKNILWKSLLATPALLSATLTVSAAIVTAGVASAADAPKSVEVAQAATAETSDTSLDPVKAYGSEGADNAEISQVTSVSQLSDVRPTDWAFQALQSLVERYGCIVGYPDKTFRGNRALTRFEFAAGLNACLDRVNELIAAATADLVKKEDLVTLQRLQEEFAAELATLRGRVDALEARATTLEKQQFSTTTKLRGEAIFSFSGALGDSKAIGSFTQRQIDNTFPPGAARDAANAAARRNVDENQTFSDRVRLSFATSFTGKDSLLTRLQARNITAFADATGTNMARLSYEGSSPSGTPANNSLSVDKLFYRFPIGAGTVTIDAIGGEFYNNVPNFNPLLASDGQGTISRFGRFNPIYRQGNSNSASGAGVTLNYPLSQALTVSLGYLADNASNPTNANGLLNGSNAALAQIAFKPSSTIDLGLTYVRGYDRGGNVNVSSGTGSLLASQPFGNAATSTDQFGIEGSIRLTPGFTLAAWGGYTTARLESRTANADADIWNWAVTLAFPDLGKKGNLAGIVFGQPPKVTSNSLGGAFRDRDTSFHLEGLYRYQVSNNISITPGIIVIFNPEHNSVNDTVYVGTVRTTFTF
ncbi:hypothetical protein C7B65_02800 [Phormidesmis priestleyi ULC007]|uniref:SLH domain-containing protein n=1 Tax=Phormidesmis priestleyi ULC007 TaxID=1920490 RepID=A0A2T1DM89_9CYAN|nr:iron uptake porin [Phormidesmis priestleyi]PSB21534.1 hypothetical protein C7B65_02800 [Phormidesmis priestleyi ULC007]PZO54574.1 MAG: hypothetical protein DCF14_01315 [Phormidesmis priestleyi]